MVRVSRPWWCLCVCVCVSSLCVCVENRPSSQPASQRAQGNCGGEVLALGGAEERVGYRPLSMRVRFLSFGFVSSESWAGSGSGLVGNHPPSPGLDAATHTPLVLCEPGFLGGGGAAWSPPPEASGPLAAQHSHDRAPVQPDKQAQAEADLGVASIQGEDGKNTMLVFSRGLLSSVAG